MSTTNWAMDPSHSELTFKVRHMMVSNVTGHFKNFTATLTTEGDDMPTAKVHLTANVESISTNNEQRDGHLKTADFFDHENHPQMIFDSTKLEKVTEEEYKLHGNLSMRGVSKPVTMKVEFGGIMTDPWGNARTGFTVDGKVNRKDFGVSFSLISETGSILLGEDVTIHANVEFVKQA